MIRKAVIFEIILLFASLTQAAMIVNLTGGGGDGASTQWEFSNLQSGAATFDPGAMTASLSENTISGVSGSITVTVAAAGDTVSTDADTPVNPSTWSFVAPGTINTNTSGWGVTSTGDTGGANQLDSTEAILLTFDLSSLTLDPGKVLVFRVLSNDGESFKIYERIGPNSGTDAAAVSSSTPAVWSSDVMVDGFGEFAIADAGYSGGASNRITYIALDAATEASPLGWRVIPEDGAYPSDDVIVAFCEVTDAAYNLPADPANTDCTAAFQAAIDDAYAAGGGTVFVPAGQYRFDGDLVVKENVTLRGRWVKPTSTQPVIGTILKIYHNRNNGSASPFIAINGASGVRDMAFWHPEQSPSSIVPYPFVLTSTAKAGSVENVTLVNAYQGMDFSTASFLNMKNVYGSPLYRGYIVDKAYAVPRMQGANFSPEYWVWSGLSGAPSTGGPHEAFMKNNGIAILIRELDAGHVTFSNVSGYLVGLQYERSPITGDNAGEQTIMGNVFADCTDALLVKSVKSLKILQCTFAGTDYGVHNFDQGGDLIFTDSNISGGIEAVYDEVTTSSHDFNFQNCSFDGSMSVSNNGTLSAVACEFVGTGLDIMLNSGVNGAIISGCTFADGPDIVNNSGASSADIVIDHTPVLSHVSPPFPSTYDAVRKPDDSTLFNVMDYGAIGNGSTDDTAAVQAALAAAQANGGGIVFFPAGFFEMSGNLNVGAGIELRGIHGSRHTSSSSTLGSVITINHGKGSDTGTAFVTLGDRSGIRGLTFHYPDQSYLTPYKYPFMIRCQGYKNYLIDNAGTNAWQAVDLDNADEHLVEYSFFGAWKKAYQIGGGSENGRIQSLHVKWDFWRDSGLDGAPVGGTEHDRGEVTCGKNLDTFTINDCTNETLFAIFNHACHSFVTQNGGTGAAYGIGVEENQRGYVFNTAPAAGTFDFVVCAVNIHNHGDWTGKYAFLVNDTYDGDVVFFNTFNRGNPEYLINCESGSITFQQGDFSSGGTRGIYTVKAAGNVTLDNLPYSPPFDLEVPTGGIFTAKHTHFNGGYSNMDVDGVVNHSLNTYSGSFITADINQDPPRDRGITMDTSNVEPIIVNTLDSSVRSPIDYKSQFKAYHLVSGSSILFNITDPDFINGAAGNVDIKILYLDDTDGTINVYYDSTSGEKLGASYSILASNGNWASKTIQVNDGRFNSATQDIRIEVLGASADPVFAHVSVESDSFLGLGDSGTDVVPPAVPTGLVATSGIGSVSLDWSDNGEPDLHAYGVYRSDTGVVPYTHIQDVFTSEYVDIGVDNGTKYYYVVTALDASNNESGISDQDSALPPDLTEDDKIDLEDLAMIAAGWLTTYNMDALSAIAENWLVY